MVEIKSLQVEQITYMGIHVYMPGYPLYFIISTKAILAPDMFDISFFHKKNHVAVILVSYQYGFEAMMNSKVVAFNETAKRCGVHLDMSGKEALMLCEDKQETA